MYLMNRDASCPRWDITILCTWSHLLGIVFAHRVSKLARLWTQ